ncbi:MAG: type I-E CRISPR-associated protein Cas7/Cse4/CasC [Acidobacteria bacterium]|nr:type I-E CRISPR-associated protein Cas7/Cse4/CasC [Acidobacteriota bacterium]
MFIEMHLIQNFAPSNLNRDDTNAPKDCDFGGFRRARISSQCLKRAVREAFRKTLTNIIPANNLAVRTKRLVQELSTKLEKTGKPTDQASLVAETVVKTIAKLKEKNLTDVLLFLGNDEINRMVSLCLENWETLEKLASNETPAKPEAASKKGKKDKDSSEAKDPIPKEITNGMLNLMDGGKAVDLALFGRMLASLPDKNIDAACQVAHAISTHKVNTEFDFFTAVDDIVTNSDDQGAGMLGTVEFNSACFYRYANIDLNQLKHNLSDDEDLTLKAIQAFVKASVKAIPTGKQNSMAAQNPPSFVLVVLRKSGLWSLANAFLKPVYVKQNSNDLATESVKKLTDYWAKLVNIYGDDEIIGKWFISLDLPENLNPTLSNAQSSSLNTLIDQIMGQITGNG